MSHTDKTTDVAQALVNLLKDDMINLGLKDVLYGRQINLPTTPVVVVTCAPKRRELSGVSAPGGRTMNTMQIYIDVHNSKVGDEATERLFVDKLAESVEQVVHQDTTVGGIIIHGFITDWDPGETFLQNGEFRTVRMTFQGRSETYLSQ